MIQIGWRRALDNHHQILQLAPAHRVLNGMQMRAQPCGHILRAQALGQLRLMHHGAVSQVPGHTRRAVAQHLRTYRAAHAICANQGITFNQLVGAGANGDDAILLGKAGDGLIEVEVHLGQVLQSLEQQLMQIGPVNRCVACAIAVHHLRAQRQMAQLLP